MFNDKINFTKFIYQELAWGPLYKINDGKFIKNQDNNAQKYILNSLKKLKIKKKDLKNKKVFNIGTGREARVFAKLGAEVTHLDLGKQTVKELKKWARKNKKKVKTFSSDLKNFNLGHNKFDLVFLAGVYQHFSNPALNLIKIINSIKKDGLIYLGFYRSGEFKYFIVDAIRHLINYSMIKKIREFNSAIFCLNEFNHYQSSRVMDDFFIPYKHNFHPKDIIHDFKKLKMKIIYIDNDMREYNHESKDYFSIGADRIYAKKQNDVLIKNSLIKNLKTIKGKNQIEDLKYKHKIIIQNIKLIKSIKYKFKKKHFSEESIISLALSLYQLTRPFKFSKSYYYSLAKKNGKHETINLMLKNFMKNFDQSSKKNRLFNKSMKNLVKNKL